MNEHMYVHMHAGTHADDGRQRPMTMDLLDILLGHDEALTLQVLQLSGDLTDAQLDQEFDIGLRTLRRTLTHSIANVEVWTALMAGERPERTTTDIPATVADLQARFVRAHAQLRALATSVQREGRMNAAFVDVLDDPPQEKSLGGGIAHLITHSMLHRSEALHILQRLGVPNLPEGDVLSWEAAARRERGIPMDPPRVLAHAAVQRSGGTEGEEA